MPPPEFEKTSEIPAPELPSGPESGQETLETASERPKEQAEVKPIEEAAPPQAPITPTPISVAAAKDPELVTIENILSEGLVDLYQKMSPSEQAKFKVKGEEVASKIKRMIDSAAVQAKKIVEWIKEWLRLIPRVNHYFFDQEAKIKTDAILRHIEEKKEITIE